MQHSFIKNVKEHKECSILFYKERKRMRELFVLLKRKQKKARTLRSFEKNGCPTLHKIRGETVKLRKSFTSLFFKSNESNSLTLLFCKE